MALETHWNSPPGVHPVPDLRSFTEMAVSGLFKSTIMPGFFKEIDTAHGPLTFHFTRLRSPEGCLFFITVRTSLRQVYLLELQQKGRQWVLATKNIPAWLQALEGEFAKAVQTHAPVHSGQ